MHVWILLLPLLLLVWASVHDLRRREIPDWIAVALAATGALAAGLGWANVQWWMVFGGALAGGLVGLAMFRWARFGGGDAKLLVGLGCLLGPVGLAFFLVWMALAGGLLAVAALGRGQRDFAYAPALAAGYLGYLVWPGEWFGQWFQWV